MTRFARASGSKASNQRVPEEATPWSVLKQQAEATNENEEENEDTEEKNDWKSIINQEKKVEKNLNSVWCEFDDSKGDKSKSKGKVNKKSSKRSIGGKRERSASENSEIGKNIEEGESNETIKLSKREKRKCFGCHKRGHTLSECPEAQIKSDKNKESAKENDHELAQCSEVGKKGLMCYKCGKEGHILHDCPVATGNPYRYAVCLNCKKVGHLAKTCFNKGTIVNARNLKREAVDDKVLNINGQDVTVTLYNGFRIKKDDAERIEKLKQDLISRGVSHEEIVGIVKKERRNAEKDLARMKKKVCFHCREGGHNMSSCPNRDNNGINIIGSGICYKCGSTEHSHLDCRVVSNKNSFKFAVCFICKEEGHIAKQCPDNPRGLYPKGGGCKVCGDVTHFKKDCPQLQESTVKVKIGTIQDGELEAIEDDTEVKKLPDSLKRKKKKIVKFN